MAERQPTTRVTATFVYAGPVPFHRRRSVIRIGLSIASIIGFGSIAAWIGPTVSRRVELLRCQRECLGFVVGGSGASPAAFPAPPWQTLQALMNGSSASSGSGNTVGTAFLHGRRRPDGELRLVVMEISDQYTGRIPASSLTVLTLWPTVIIPGNVGRDPHEGTAKQFGQPIIHVGLDPGDAILPSNLDPTDATHFQVRVRRRGRILAIDCWLDDNDMVTISPQSIGMD